MNLPDAIAHAAARVQFYQERLRQRGLLWLVSRIVKRVAIAVGWLLLVPFTLVLHLSGFRRVTVFTDRIGHLAAEIDCFLKEKSLGKLPTRRWFILAPPHRIANRHLLEYWHPHVTIITDPLLCSMLSVMTSWRGLMVFDISHYLLKIDATATYYVVNLEWGMREPILCLSERDHSRGWDLLETMGMPRGSWFVCLHARNSGFSPEDEVLHAHRNSDVLRLIPAMELITSRGGWCVQMGDPTTKPLPEMPKVIDYAHHPARSEWMDIFLCASCRFFLGSSSGLFIVSDVFGVPCALANMVPLSTLGYAPKDISIPKLLRRKGEQDYLPFGEIFGSPLANYRLAKLYQDAGVEVEENSTEDILGLAREMLDRLEAKPVYDKMDDMLQQRFHSLLRPGHYSYGTASRVGVAFLRKYHRLLA
ncbi:MAG: TIGR04372 family glycosyltransferase [Dongiaceae bacterium]